MQTYRFRAIKAEGMDTGSDCVVLEIPPDAIAEIKREVDACAETEAASPVEPGTMYLVQVGAVAVPALSSLLSTLTKWRDSYGCDQSFEGSEDARLAHAFDAWRHR